MGSDKARLLLTHYENLCKLAAEQLEAAQSGKLDLIDIILGQKQMIMEHIEKLVEEYDVTQLAVGIRRQIRKQILTIIGLDEESQRYLEKQKAAVQKEALSIRTENQLTEKYAAFMENNQLFDQSR